MSGTRALQVLKGLGIILALALVFSILDLQTVSWMLSWLLNAAAVVLVILFQPEIRRALEKLGGGKFFGVVIAPREDADRIVEELMRAIINMSKRKVGALIVFERKTGLKDIIETGTFINAEITAELIENIFYPNTPLHDGAVIIKEGKIMAAGCFLPLSDNKQISSELGTRHRAALGVSEVSDSYTIVVSEETGVISYMFDGMLTRYLDIPTLRDILERIFIKTENADKKPPVFKFRRKVGEK
jgi:diadenylate cyclase